MSFLNRSHVSEVATPTVRWDRTQGAFTYSKRIDNKWRNDVPITGVFAMDVHMARHGYEQWQTNGESQARHVVLDSVSRALPAKPEGKAMAIYSVPICSPEIGGRCDLVVHGQGPTDALCDLFDEVHGHIHDLDEQVVPIIRVSCETSDFGNKPVFAIEDWERRPDRWGKSIVNFKG